MKSWIISTGLAVALGAAAGCIPEKRVVWSPDGSKAAVAAANGVYLIDGEGKVLGSPWVGASPRCDWFRDGKRLAVAYSTKAKNWSDIAAAFTPEQMSDLKPLAKKTRERVLAHEGSWEDFQLDADEQIPNSMKVGVLLYMRDNQPEGLAEKLGAKWDDIKKLEVDLWHLRILSVDGEKFEPGAELLLSVNEIAQPRVAPNGKNIAFLKVMENEVNEQPALHVLPVEGGQLRAVSENVAMEYDWSPDSMSLAFVHCAVARPKEGSSLSLGSLATIRVAGTDGALLKQWEKQEEKVGLIFNDVLTVRWLTDGRLMFSSAEVTLPATTHDLPQRWSLFVLDPRTPASVCRVMRRDLDQPLEPSIPLFTISPDEKQVLMPASGGRVVFYDLASGESKLLGEVEDTKGGVRSLPAWRSPGEICFVRLVAGAEGGEPKAEIALFKNGKMKTISEQWPEEMKEGWLVGK